MEESFPTSVLTGDGPKGASDSNPGRILQLPVEIQTHILSFLDLYDKIVASLACKQWDTIFHTAPAFLSSKYPGEHASLPRPPKNQKIKKFDIHGLFGRKGPKEISLVVTADVDTGTVERWMLQPYCSAWVYDISNSSLIDEPAFRLNPAWVHDRQAREALSKNDKNLVFETHRINAFRISPRLDSTPLKKWIKDWDFLPLDFMTGGYSQYVSPPAHSYFEKPENQRSKKDCTAEDEEIVVTNLTIRGVVEAFAMRARNHVDRGLLNELKCTCSSTTPWICGHESGPVLKGKKLTIRFKLENLSGADSWTILAILRVLNDKNAPQIRK